MVVFLSIRVNSIESNKIKTPYTTIPIIVLPKLLIIG